METRSAGEAGTGEGLFTIEARFYTENLIVVGDVVTPEARLSDHLNSSATTVDIEVTRVERLLAGDHIDLAHMHATIPKAHLLFVLPVREPERRLEGEKVAWTRTAGRRCWAGLGRYSLTGQVYSEAARDARLFLRSLEQRQFLPFADATVAYGSSREYEHSAIIVNQQHLEVIVLMDDE